MKPTIVSTDAKNTKNTALKHVSPISRAHLIIVALVFGTIGGYLLYHSFAASVPVATLQAEQMTLPASQWDYAYADSTASGGKAVALLSGGTMTGSVNFPSTVTSLTITAKGTQCSGAPTMTISLDGKALLTNTGVTSTSWAAYSVNLASPISSGTHTLSIAYTNDGYTSSCDRNLYVDVTNFYGPSPAAVALVASIEAEKMTLPASQWDYAYADSTASGGKAVALLSGGTMTGSVNLLSAVSSLNIIAKGDQCSGAPTMTVSLDGVTIMNQLAVSSTSWGSYSASFTSPLNAGAHSLSIAYTNDGYTSSCDRNLYVDVTNFYGPGSSTATTPPPPTVSISASPSSLSAGTSSTLTWASTNASSCTASGAWSGSENTSGSTSTGALNQNTTYSLTCAGLGGQATASASVTVSAATGSGGTTGSTPSGGDWKWNAMTATLNSNSASLISAFQSQVISGGTYMVTSTAIQDAPAGAPTVTFSTSESIKQVQVPFPAGTTGSCASDHAATIRQGSLDYDISDWSLGSYSAFGVSKTAVGAVQESGNNANAAGMTERDATILPSELANGVIPHAMQIRMQNPGNTQTVYPATSYVANFGSNGLSNGLPLGTWLRLDPTYNVNNISDRNQRIIATALQQYGAFVRDIGSGFTLEAADMVNKGGNTAAWSAAGVTLTGDCNGQGPYIYGLGQIPWAKLQVLLPPAH